MEMSFAIGPDPQRVELIERAAERVEREESVRFSPLAKHLMAVVLTAVDQDPSSSWEEEASLRRDKAGVLMQAAPDLLARLAKEESNQAREISSFEVLHWMTRNLDRFCPFRKAKG